MKKGLLIYQRIILIQFISILIIMILFGIYFNKSNKNKEIKDLKHQTDHLSERLRINLAKPLQNLDSKTCNSMLTQEVNNKYVLAIIINKNGKLFTGKIKKENGEVINIDNIVQHKEFLNKKYSIKKIKILNKNGPEKKEIGELIIYTTDSPVKEVLSSISTQIIFQIIIIVILLSIITFLILNQFLNKPLKQLTRTASRIARGETELKAHTEGSREIATLANAFNSMTEQLGKRADIFKKTNDILSEIITKAKEIIVILNSSSKEIDAAAHEQTNGATEQASGITEVSATLEELSITAKQITKNVGDLVGSSEEVTKLLEESEKNLLDTVTQLKNVGNMSNKNASKIGELGKKSKSINNMVTLIKSIANKTDMLSINASIEASKDKKAGKGFRVIATEIRQLSQKTIDSAKEVEKTAREIQDFIQSIVIASENEAKKVIESGGIVKNIYENLESIVLKINDNFSSTQKIDVSIKQQESGSRQAADTMKQMSDIARQSAETARQTSAAVNEIVNLSNELELIIEKLNDKNIGADEEKVQQESEMMNQDFEEDTNNVFQDVFNNINSFLSKQVPKVIQLSGKYYNKIRSKTGKSDNQ